MAISPCHLSGPVYSRDRSFGPNRFGPTKRLVFMSLVYSFSALTLLVGREEGHSACINLGGCGGGGAISPVRVVPTRTVGACASNIFHCSIKIQKTEGGETHHSPLLRQKAECFFGYRPTRVVPEQRPLNGGRWLLVYSCKLVNILKNLFLIAARNLTYFGILHDFTSLTCKYHA